MCFGGGRGDLGLWRGTLLLILLESTSVWGEGVTLAWVGSPGPPLIVHEIVEPWQPPGVLSDDCPVFLKFRSSTIIILCHGLTNSHHIDCPYLPENIGYQYIG